MTSLHTDERSIPERRADDNETVIHGQKKALELAVHGAPLSAVLDVLVRTVETQSSMDIICSILLLDHDAKRLRHGAAPNLPAEYNAAIDGIEVGPSVGSCGTAAYTARPVVVSDIETDPLWTNFKVLAMKHRLRACWSMPIFSSEGTVLGTFALYHHVVATPTERDREIVELLAHTAGVVIERDLNARRRAAAEAELRAQKERQLARTAALFEHAPAGIAVLVGEDFVFDVANPRYLELVGGRPNLGKPIHTALPEVANQGIVELLQEVRRSGKPYIGRALRVMLARGPNGEMQEGFFDFVYQPIPETEGEIENILVIAFDVTTLVAGMRSAQALSEEMAQQSRETQKALLEMRAAKEVAEKRLAELESTRGKRT